MRASQLLADDKGELVVEGEVSDIQKGDIHPARHLAEGDGEIASSQVPGQELMYARPHVGEIGYRSRGYSQLLGEHTDE
jgi:hypothetical protein